MRTHRDLLLATRPFAQEHRWLSWWHVLSTLAVSAGLFVVATSSVAWWGRLAAGFCLGLVLVRFFVLYHDFQHGAILRGSSVANWLMSAFGLTMLNPPSSWKRSHDHHHKHNTSFFGLYTGSFSIMSVDSYRAASPRDRLIYLIERNPLTILFGYVTVFLIGMSVVPFLANPRRHIDAGLSILCHAVFLSALFLSGTDDLVFAALIPCSIASCAGAFLFYAQHNFPGFRIHVGQDWDYVTAALESSSYIKTGPILAWCTGNIGYHHVHHLNHHIPFYRLPEAMAALEELQSPVTLTLTLSTIWACLRLKLWDTTTGQLVTWAALKTPPESTSQPQERRPNSTAVSDVTGTVRTPAA